MCFQNIVNMVNMPAMSIMALGCTAAQKYLQSSKTLYSHISFLCTYQLFIKTLNTQISSLIPHFISSPCCQCYLVSAWASPKLVTIKISHCYKVYQKGCNSYKQCVVTILLHRLFVVRILLSQINVVTIQISCNNFVKRCNNVKLIYLLYNY